MFTKWTTTKHRHTRSRTAAARTFMLQRTVFPISTFFCFKSFVVRGSGHVPCIWYIRAVCRGVGWWMNFLANGCCIYTKPCTEPAAFRRFLMIILSFVSTGIVKLFWFAAPLEIFSEYYHAAQWFRIPPKTKPEVEKRFFFFTLSERLSILRAFQVKINCLL